MKKDKGKRIKDKGKRKKEKGKRLKEKGKSETVRQVRVNLLKLSALKN